MADFLTGLRDVMNPHVLFKIKVPEKMDVDRIKQQVRAIMERWDVVTWGWQVATNTVTFRVYEPHRYTARGRLEEAGFKPEKEKEPSSPLVPPSTK